MSSVHAFFPVDLYLQHRHPVTLRRAAILCLSVALICAASVFIALYRFDQSYAVAAVRPNAPTASASYALAARPARGSHVNAGSTITKTEKQEAPRVEPVARTHQELLALERTGARNYVEFTLARSGGFHPVGPIEICLWRTDSKHAAVQASVLYKQRRIDFKRLKLNERVSIPAAHSGTLELVVNKVTKNQITGYVSEPKSIAWE